VIVWVSSYPRSGNTLLRIVLNRMFGVRTSTVYDIDGVAARLGQALVGFAERPAAYESMRAAPEIYFVKTHQPSVPPVEDTDRAICLVRDGRDALVSWARQRTEDDAQRFESELLALLALPLDHGAGQWGHNVLSWLQPAVPHRVVLTYDELIRDPLAATARVITGLVPEAELLPTGTVPSFAELHDLDERFFRRGFVGTHRDEMPEDLERAFWARPDNVAAMHLIAPYQEHFLKTGPMPT